MEEFNKALEEVVSCIQNSSDYEMCISLKKQMNDNEELMNLIENIKKLQKKYIRSNYDNSIKKELDQLEEELNKILVYYIYSEHLEKVNEMIEFVKNCLNDYFYQSVLYFCQTESEFHVLKRKFYSSACGYRYLQKSAFHI